MTEPKFKQWTVVNVVHHDNGETTLTLRDEHGTTKTQNYPAGAKINRVVQPHAE